MILRMGKSNAAGVSGGSRGGTLPPCETWANHVHFSILWTKRDYVSVNHRVRG